MREIYICIIQQLVLVLQSVWPSGVPDVLIFSHSTGIVQKLEETLLPISKFEFLHLQKK